MSSFHPKDFSSPEVTSSYAKPPPPMAEERDEESENSNLAGEEEELELGLTLGARTGAKAPRSGAGLCGQWGDYCRILTAKDFSSVGGPRASPMSSSSSVSSSSSMGGKRGAGSKRTADPAHQNHMVGWPPIRASRINSLSNHAKENSPVDGLDVQCKQSTGDQIVTPQNVGNIAMSIENIAKGTHDLEKKKPKTFFVKVNMDGMPIGRKVDLNVHRSYESLALTLEDMFQNNPKPKANALEIMKSSKLLDGSSEFALTYEDKDGDWMLVGDVPWGMFLSTVKRLRIMRMTDAHGLANIVN